MPRVTFAHLDGLTVDAAIGASIFEVAMAAGKPLASACGAKATCGLCRVKVLGGEPHLTAPNDAEKKHLGNVYFITKIRLGCQARITGDGEITVEQQQKKP